MIAIFYAIISLLGWGVGDVFTTSATRKIGSFNTSFYGYFFGLVLATFYVPFALDGLKNFGLPLIALTVILAVAQLLAFFAYNEGLKIGNSSLVGTIAGTFTSLVVVLSILFLGEKLLIPQLVTIVIIFLGLFLSTIDYRDLKNRKTVINKGTVFALLAMIGWAIYFTFIKIPVLAVGFFWPSYVTSIVGTVFFIILGPKRIKMPKLGFKTGFAAIFMSSTLLTIGSFSFNYAVGRGLSSVVAPIAGAYPALFALLAALVFKDPIAQQQKVGMIVTLFGIILLAYFSG